MHLADDPSETKSCFYTLEDEEYTVKPVYAKPLWDWRICSV